MPEYGRTANWELKLAGFICLAISLSHLIGLWEIKWVSERIPAITLLVLGLFILFLTRVLERIDYRDDLDALKDISQRHADQNESSQGHMSQVLDNLQVMIKELPGNLTAGLDVDQFQDVGDVYNYVSAKLRNANTSIKDITWGSYTGYRTEYQQRCYEGYVTTIEDVCKKGKVIYQEISSLSDQHYFHRSANLLKYYNYHLAYHDISATQVPLISYVIIDEKEVVLGFFRVPGITFPPDSIVYLSVTNPLLVHFFFDYFVAIWEKAEKLKEAKKIHNSKIEEIAAKMGIELDQTLQFP